MSAPPYMKLFWGDYHKRTRHLTRDQHGAYFLLIGEAWQLGGALPDDDVKLAAWSLCTADEWSAIKPIVMEFFSLRRGKWWHDRVREELASYESTSRKRKEAGKKGGKASVGKESGNTEANASLLPPKPEPEPEPDKDSPLPPKGEKKSRRKTASTIPDDFPDLEAMKAGRDQVLTAGRAVHVRTEAEKFRDYALSRDWKKADWAATWRNWIRSACERAPAIGVATGKPEAHDPWPMRMRSWHRQEGWNDVDWGPEPGEPGCLVPERYLRPEAAE